MKYKLLAIWNASVVYGVLKESDNSILKQRRKIDRVNSFSPPKSRIRCVNPKMICFHALLTSVSASTSNDESQNIVYVLQFQAGKIFLRILVASHKKRQSEISSKNAEHGFVENKSTESAAHDLVSLIESNFNKKLFTAVGFFDISSAFDVTWPPSILNSLYKNSCPTYIVKMIKSFLEDRVSIILDGIIPPKCIIKNTYWMPPEECLITLSLEVF